MDLKESKEVTQEGMGGRKGRDGRMNFLEKKKLKHNKSRNVAVQTRPHSSSVKHCTRDADLLGQCDVHSQRACESQSF